MVRCDNCNTAVDVSQAISGSWGATFCSVGCRHSRQGSSEPAPPRRAEPLADNVKCGKCGTVSDFAKSNKCPECGDYLYQYKAAGSAPSPLHTPTLPVTHRPQGIPLYVPAIGLVGAAMVFLGCFSPVVSIPLAGSITFLNNGNGDGGFVATLAAASAAMAFTKFRGWQALTGLLVGGISFYDFNDLQNRIAKTVSGVDSSLAGNPYAGFGQAAVRTVQMQWGWGLLFVGAAMLITSGALALRAAMESSR